MSPRTCLDTLAKAEQQGLGAAGRESPDTLSKRLKNIIPASEIVSLLREVQLTSPVTMQWRGSSNVHTYTCLHFYTVQKTGRTGKQGKLRLTSPIDFITVLSTLRLCYRSCKFGYIQGMLHHADIWHRPSGHSPQQRLPILQCWLP